MLGRDIVMADRRMLRVLGIGDVRIELPNGDKRTKSILKDVIHAPDMAFTLISVRRLDHAKCSVTFQDGVCMIKNPTGQVMAKVPHSNGLYRVNQSHTQANSNYATLSTVKSILIKLTKSWVILGMQQSSMQSQMV